MRSAAACSPYRPDIEGLRAVAVLPVLFYHSGLGFAGGYFGVDVFFVISGFLITRIIYVPVIDGTFSATQFYERRIRRLFPALFAMLLGTTIWAMCWLIAPDLEDFGGSLVAASGYTSNLYFYFTNTAYFAQAAITKPLLHTWSLGVEEQFYIFVPMGLWLLARFAPRRSHLPVIATISLLCFGLSAGKSAQGSPAVFYLLPCRAWELGLGAAVAVAPLAATPHRHLRAAACLAAVVAIFASLLGFPTTLSPAWRALPPTLGAATILAIGEASTTAVHRLLAVPPLTFIGKISYPLYLWHWPVIVALSYGDYGPAPPGRMLLGILVSAALAALSWRFLEQPVRGGRLLGARKHLFASSALASAACVATGLVLLTTHGLPGRHPQLALLLGDIHLSAPGAHCFITQGGPVPDPLCVRGAPGVAPSFILVGDSHAHRLSYGLFEAARARGIAGVEFTAGNFVPFAEFQTRFRPDATRLVPLFEAYLLRHARLRTIIVTASWAFAATGHTYRGGERWDWEADNGMSRDAGTFRLALERLVSHHPDLRFIFLDDVPTGETLSPIAYARSLYAGRPNDAAGLPRREADAQRATYEPILKRLAIQRHNVLYIPILSRLCGPVVCPATSGGESLYSDSEHLSYHGSAALSVDLRAVFDQRREWARSGDLVGGLRIPARVDDPR